MVLSHSSSSVAGFFECLSTNVAFLKYILFLRMGPLSMSFPMTETVFALCCPVLVWVVQYIPTKVTVSKCVPCRSFQRLVGKRFGFGIRKQSIGKSLHAIYRYSISYSWMPQILCFDKENCEHCLGIFFLFVFNFLVKFLLWAFEGQLGFVLETAVRINNINYNYNLSQLVFRALK